MNKIQLPPRCPNQVTKQKKTNPLWEALNNMKKKNNGGQNNFNRNNNNFSQNNQGGNKQGKTFEGECGSTKFDPLPDSQEFVDYQEIKIQESFKTIKPGNIPRTVWVIMEV